MPRPTFQRARRLLASLRNQALYRISLARGRAAGAYTYEAGPPNEGRMAVDVFLPADAATPEEATDWCRRQTFRDLVIHGLQGHWESVWRVDRSGPLNDPASDPLLNPGARARWFMAPGGLPAVYPAFVESAVGVAAAEEVAGVCLLERIPNAPVVTHAHDLLTEAAPWTLWSSTSMDYDARIGKVSDPGQRRLLVKLVEDQGETRSRSPETYHRFRRGPYLSTRPLPPLLRVWVQDVSGMERRTQEPQTQRPGLLVTVPFLARGGAEHTLFESLKVLRSDFNITFVTLAPHRPELDDRRGDFHDEISSHMICLGDLVHPAAMPGLLRSLIRSTRAEVLYNANSTTLFYDFGPSLKADFPDLRILDHLYDHLVGYIERYEDPSLLNWIDACVAENRPIARVLNEKRGWPLERLPVIWSCGRPAEAFPANPAAARREKREELGIGDETLVLLTAARMHEQKRPLDLVALAQRFQDEDVLFLVVGGGPLEDDVDRAIAASEKAKIRRLPFRTDIPELITAADVGCLVSNYEGLPVFMIECLQAGRPFLGTNVGDMGAVLKATGAGIVVEEPGDLDGLERAVRQLLDPERRSALAARCAAAAAQLDIKTCAERYAKAFRNEPLADPVLGSGE